jgi:chorismate mutase
MKIRFLLFPLLLLTNVDAFLVPNTMKIQFIRKTIDVIDDKIHDLICARLECAEQLKDLKPQIRDPIREVTIIARLQDKDKLDPVMIKNIWKTLFQESYRVQGKKDLEE